MLFRSDVLCAHARQALSSMAVRRRLVFPLMDAGGVKGQIVLHNLQAGLEYGVLRIVVKRIKVELEAAQGLTSWISCEINPIRRIGFITQLLCIDLHVVLPYSTYCGGPKR